MTLNKSKMTSFIECLDKATNPLLQEPDYDAIVEICQLIEDGYIEPHLAVNAINKKLIDKNSCTVILALEVLKAIFHCGRIIRKIICTLNYMEFLETIIESTKTNIIIKNTIVMIIEEWVTALQYYPRYDAPEKFLNILKAEVSPHSSKTEHKNKNEKLQTNKSETNILNNENAKKVLTVEKIIKTNLNGKNYLKTKSVQKSNDKEQSSDLLKEVIEQRKKQHKQYLKSQGKPTSSDEEDNPELEKLNDTLESSGTKKECTQGLPKDLQNLKNQRLQLDAGIKEYRSKLHENYVANNCSTELSQCVDPNCENCLKYKNIVIPNFELPKRLPPELRKVKESKAALKDSFEDVKEIKGKHYHQNSSRKSTIHKNRQNLGKNDYLLGGIPPTSPNNNVSRIESPQRPLLKTKAMEEEEQDLNRAIALSLVDTGMEETYYEDDLQEAINASMELEEDKNFSYLPKLDDKEEDSLLLLSLQLSLDKDNESSTRQDPSEEDQNQCSICMDKKTLLYLRPCNHIICCICIETYKSNSCPICRQHYNSVSSIPLF